MPFTELSMGMSGDYKIAIRNGATLSELEHHSLNNGRTKDGI